MGMAVPPTDNFYAALNSAVFIRWFVYYIPKEFAHQWNCQHISRINASGTGQFERTFNYCRRRFIRVVSRRMYSPQRDENQLHAAVVEIITHKMLR